MKIENEGKLLQELRENNCRDILVCEINMRVAERSKTKYPNRLDEIETFIKTQKQRRDDLIEGIKVIDTRLDETTN